MSEWIERTMAQEIRKRIKQAITGPRQSDKTTLLKSLFPDYEYVSLENPDHRSFAQEDPNGFLQQ